MNNIKQSLKDLYAKAKLAKVGEEAKCPSCKTMFVKDNYQQAFCRTQGGTVCKDNYWNNVTPTKRNNKTRISPASAVFLANKRSLNAPNVVGGSGRVTGRTSEGYRIMDGIAYDEFDEAIYHVDADDDRHPFDLED